jgi:hypothetical protein
MCDDRVLACSANKNSEVCEQQTDFIVARHSQKIITIAREFHSTTQEELCFCLQPRQQPTRKQKNNKQKRRLLDHHHTAPVEDNKLIWLHVSKDLLSNT